MSNEAQETFKKLPGVMSLTRRINTTDALFYSLLADGTEKPVLVMRSGLRGTQNVNEKSNGVRNVNNIQMTDTAKTDVDAVGMLVKMSVRFMPLSDAINSMARSAKDNPELLPKFKASFDGFIQRAIDNNDGIREIGCRYARNIANGRWLWRNKDFAQNVSIEVTANGKSFSFNALKVPTKSFENYTADEIEIGMLIADSLAGKNDVVFKIQAKLDFGEDMNKSIEVYPSQNYLTDKPDGFARSLYAVGQSKLTRSPEMIEFESSRVVGHAAIRDTKAANALRVLDTWYPGFEDFGNPIAVEPSGANLSTQMMHREGKESSFAYMKRLNCIETDSPEGMFLIAAIIRGGVYSESGDK